MESKASKASRVEDSQGWMKQPTEKSSGGHPHQKLATVAEQLEFTLGVGAGDTNTSYGLQ